MTLENKTYKRHKITFFSILTAAVLLSGAFTALPSAYSQTIVFQDDYSSNIGWTQVPGTALRLGGIYGPGRTRLLENVRSGRARYRAGTPRYTNRIHRDDCAGAIAHLMQEEAPQPLYLGVDDDPAEEVVVLRWLAGVLGAPEPRPEKGVGAGDRRSRGNKRCQNALLRDTGYTFHYPTFREGYTSLIGQGR